MSLGNGNLKMKMKIMMMAMGSYWTVHSGTSLFKKEAKEEEL